MKKRDAPTSPKITGRECRRLEIHFLRQVGNTSFYVVALALTSHRPVRSTAVPILFAGKGGILKHEAASRPREDSALEPTTGTRGVSAHVLRSEDACMVRKCSDTTLSINRLGLRLQMTDDV
jgi:hypothetical protein